MAYFGRGKNKVQNPYVIEDIYKYYISMIDKDSPFFIDYKTYRSILEDYLKDIVELIFEGKEYSIPSGLGKLQIVKVMTNYYDIKFLPIDWEATVKYKKKIHTLNEHSKGFKFKFYWFKKYIKTSINNNFILYRLIMTRYNKRLLAKIIKSGEKDYIQIR